MAKGHNGPSFPGAAPRRFRAEFQSRRAMTATRRALRCRFLKHGQIVGAYPQRIRADALRRLVLGVPIRSPIPLCEAQIPPGAESLTVAMLCCDAAFDFG
jgi:hypothetical protein